MPRRSGTKTFGWPGVVISDSMYTDLVMFCLYKWEETMTYSELMRSFFVWKHQLPKRTHSGRRLLTG